jgi:hypothetical protein
MGYAGKRDGVAGLDHPFVAVGGDVVLEVICRRRRRLAMKVRWVVCCGGCWWWCRYFNNELSEEAKRLIGDIAPKKIEPVLVSVLAWGTIGRPPCPVCPLDIM